MDGRRPVLIFWQEVLPGDLLKMKAQSNVSTTGGGARDLRFPDVPFRSVFERMFAEDADIDGRHVRIGRLVWDEGDGRRREQVVEYWPPTDARPGEGRLARIHEIEPLRTLPASRDDRLILLLVLDDARETRAFYAIVDELEARWHEDVAIPILDCLRAPRRPGTAARGWLDLVTGQRYCHGE